MTNADLKHTSSELFTAPQLLTGSLILSVGGSLAAMALGGGLGWFLTVPLVGLAAHFWPRWLLLLPVLGLGLSAALYGVAQLFGAPTAPVMITAAVYLLLAGSMVLAIYAAVRLRRELEASYAHAELEQSVLEIMAQIAQLSARTELDTLEAARLALHLVLPVLHLDTALLLTGSPDTVPQLETLLPGEGSLTFPDLAAEVWQAHLAQLPTFSNQIAQTMANCAAPNLALAALPLHLPGKVPVSLVALRCFQANSRWGVHDRQLLLAVARAVRQAAERQAYVSALEHSAHHDALTGCLNRHAFVQALRWADQAASDYSLVLMDLDGFKALNDREGHARGDEALRLLAELLRAAFPSPAAVYRLGGDEFAVLGAANPDNSALLVTVSEVHQQLGAAGLTIGGISVGAALSHEAAGGDAVLALADRRMYLMKQQRRQLTFKGTSVFKSESGSPLSPGEAAQPLSVPLENALQLLGKVLEARDTETHDHSVRVVHWALALGQRLGLSGAQLAALKEGAYLHDLGKLVIPDRVLLKPGPLNAEEWALMQAHADEGHRLASRLEFLDPQALEVIRSHHERWDGRGYPDRLAGDDIPLLARLYTVVDVFDALTSRRPYKEAWPVDQALAELEAQSGRQFDPMMVSAFLELWNKQRFQNIYQEAAKPSTAPLVLAKAAAAS
ncbi:HD domain-containing phosphohydrolase [Deinococcus sp.]|uniref:HD domain-containing phosphohydrolase n=1 Tax=Deinococcus sp. TaxID=47478 RepID=UPI003B5A9DB7